MQKTAKQLRGGDTMIVEAGHNIEIINTGEDPVTGEMVIFWNNWDNPPFRLHFTQIVETL